MYSLKSERKSIPFSSENTFFSEVKKVELLTDEYDNNILYGAAKNKETVCIFLADFSKLKILALGFMNSY